MNSPRAVTCLVLCLAAWLSLAAPARGQAVPYDVVIAGGRVMDPETKLDAVRHVGIKDGKIAVISEKPLAGMRMQAFDGVTTALELENGTLPIGSAYAAAAKEGGPINYGYSSSWSVARMMALAGFKTDGTLKNTIGAFGTLPWKRFATADESHKVLDLIEEGLREGAIGVGVALGYGPDS